MHISITKNGQWSMVHGQKERRQVPTGDEQVITEEEVNISITRNGQWSMVNGQKERRRVLTCEE